MHSMPINPPPDSVQAPGAPDWDHLFDMLGIDDDDYDMLIGDYLYRRPRRVKPARRRVKPALKPRRMM